LFQDSFIYFLISSKGASACFKLSMFEEAITWCNKGLAVSFISYYSHIFLFDCGEAELPEKK